MHQYYLRHPQGYGSQKLRKDMYDLFDSLASNSGLKHMISTNNLGAATNKWIYETDYGGAILIIPNEKALEIGPDGNLCCLLIQMIGNNRKMDEFSRLVQTRFDAQFTYRNLNNNNASSIKK